LKRPREDESFKSEPWKVVKKKVILKTIFIKENPLQKFFSDMLRNKKLLCVCFNIKKTKIENLLLKELPSTVDGRKIIFSCKNPVFI